MQQSDKNRMSADKLLTDIWSRRCRSFSLFKGRTRVKHSLSGNKARMESRICCLILLEK